MLAWECCRVADIWIFPTWLKLHDTFILLEFTYYRRHKLVFVFHICVLRRIWTAMSYGSYRYGIGAPSSLTGLGYSGTGYSSPSYTSSGLGFSSALYGGSYGSSYSSPYSSQLGSSSGLGSGYSSRSGSTSSLPGLSGTNYSGISSSLGVSMCVTWFPVNLVKLGFFWSC